VPDVHDAAPGRVARPSDVGPSLAQRVANLEERLATLESALGVSVSPSPPDVVGEPN